MQSVYPSTRTPISDETIWWRAWSRPKSALLLSNSAVVGELIYFAPSPESVLPPKAMILPVTSAIVNIRRLTNLSDSDEPAPTTSPAAKSNLSGIFFCLAAVSKSLSAPRARPICQLLTLSSESCLSATYFRASFPFSGCARLAAKYFAAQALARAISLGSASSLVSRGLVTRACGLKRFDFYSCAVR